MFLVSPFCAMSDSIDRSALMALIWFSILIFHLGCCPLLLLLFGFVGVLLIFSDIMYAVTYCSRFIWLRLGVFSSGTIWIVWFACLMNTLVFSVNAILGRGGLSEMLTFSHSALAFLISLTYSSISEWICKSSAWSWFFIRTIRFFY